MAPLTIKTTATKFDPAEHVRKHLRTPLAAAADQTAKEMVGVAQIQLENFHETGNWISGPRVATGRLRDSVGFRAQDTDHQVVRIVGAGNGEGYALDIEVGYGPGRFVPLDVLKTWARAKANKIGLRTSSGAQSPGASPKSAEDQIVAVAKAAQKKIERRGLQGAYFLRKAGQTVEAEHHERTTRVVKR